MENDKKTPQHDTLLVVDDEPRICKHIARMLEKSFDSVHTATSQREAEQVLGEARVTHLICDYNLGDDSPSGTELISEWRGRFPSIGLAVLFTASAESQISILPGVDKVFFKPTDIPEMIAMFSGRE
jgi:CheY-like chemotaxis protein